MCGVLRSPNLVGTLAASSPSARLESRLRSSYIIHLREQPRQEAASVHHDSLGAWAKHRGRWDCSSEIVYRAVPERFGLPSGYPSPSRRVRGLARLRAK